MIAVKPRRRGKEHCSLITAHRALLNECPYAKIRLDDLLQLFSSFDEFFLHSPEPFCVTDYVIFAEKKRMFSGIEVKPERSVFPFPGTGTGAEHAPGSPVRQEPEGVAATKLAYRNGGTDSLGRVQ